MRGRHLRLARGSPVEAPRCEDETPPRSRLPQPSPLQGLGAGAISASFETTLGGPKQRPNPSMGRDAFTRQPLHGMGRESGGVRQHQLASAIMPHSGCNQRPVSLHPPLCRCSRCRAGLRSPVRTCLTPPTTVLPTPCTFLPCKTLGGHGRRPSNTVRSSTKATPVPSTYSMPHLIRRKTLLTQQSSPRRQLALQDTDMPWA